MTRLRTLIIDDEEDGRSTLRAFLERYCPATIIVAEAASVTEAVAQLEAQHPALVFLDINMPGESGLNLFSHIPEPAFQTIFVTAHDEYALQAIKLHALDYILKPISIDELVAAVNRAESLAERPGTAPDFKGLMQSIIQQRRHEKLALPVLDGYVYVQVSDIIRCEAEGNYTVFHFTNRSKLLVCRTLGVYEDLLQDSSFIRIHHHHLINLAHVDKYQRGRGGIVTMSDKAEVTVSQRRKDDFLRMMEGTMSV